MSVDRPIAVLIAEDQAITRFGLKCALEAYADLKVVAECGDGVTAILQALAVKPNVILMDIGLPKVDGIRAAKEIKQALPNTRIIMFTASVDDELIQEALEVGADGYCLKTVAGEHLYAAIKAVHSGATWLDPGIANRLLKVQSNRNQAAVSAANTQHNELRPASLQNYDGGKTIIGDRYAIEGVLGQGGMGIVYRGRHVLMNRAVAIKMLHPEYAADDQVVARFQTEAQTLSRLSHPNLVSVFDFGVTARQEPFMVMDFHSGQSMDSYLQENGALTAEFGVALFTQVLDGLSAVHKAGIVHRDIKPSNLLISLDPQLAVKIVDFGIAKNQAAEREKLKLTNPGEVVGTPRYMSPEQCTGKVLDARSDIYALGCVMYESFTGKPIFQGDSFYDLVRQHVYESPSQLPFFQPGVSLSKEVVEVINKALRKDPDERFQSAFEMREALCKSPAFKVSD